jgi:hypothetical protein
MRFEFKPSFDRSVKSFYGEEKEEIKQVALHTIDILSHEKTVQQGVGLKHLRGDFWEVREGLRTRIVFRWEGDLLQFIFAGDHNDIKRHLRNF